ncbi:hypothetical protein Tco_1174396 [Tanacetum coccineum]
MESVTKSDIMALPYGMLLTRLFEHVRISYPYAITNIHYLVDHVMIPLFEKLVFKIMPKVKRPHPQTLTPTESSESPSPITHQEEEENNPVDNYTLDPITYIDQLPLIKGGESPEIKQAKGMFKCFGHFLSNLGKKNANSSTKNPPKKMPRIKVIDISSNESSPIQNNLINTTRDTTLALTIPSPITSQAIPTQRIDISPLAPRSLVFSTSPSSPLEPHPYLTSLENLPLRNSNPPPPSSSLGFSQTLLQQLLWTLNHPFLQSTYLEVG